MKPDKTHRFAEISRRHLYLVGGLLSVALIIFVAGGIWFSGLTKSPDDVAITPTESTANTGDGANDDGSGTGGDADITAPSTPSKPAVSPSFINLQPTVDSWLKTTNRQVGLMVYDLDNDRVAASYQANRVFNVASIYKLFYVYDGYRQLATSVEQGNTPFVTTKDYRADTYTIAECLDLMVRESYNGCADPMRSSAARSQRVQTLIAELGLVNTSNLGLSSSAADLTELLKLYYEHPDLTDELWANLADSMLRQPPTKIDSDTIYDWRQGLPAGFSTAKVYDKVGWERNADNKSWNTYADAAIVEFPKLGRSYSIVVLTTGFTDAKLIAGLGTALENAITAADATN